MVDIHFLVRSLTFPLTEDGFEKQRRTIWKIARYNGYLPMIIDNMIFKNGFKLKIKYMLF